MTDYGSIIANLRKEHNMTQAELGEALNVTFQAVSKWERNLSQPDLDTIKAMANLFNVSLDIFNDKAVCATKDTATAEQSTLGTTNTAEQSQLGTIDGENAYICSKCGKICRESEMSDLGVKKICNSCTGKKLKASAQSLRNSFFTALIAGGIVLCVITLLLYVLSDYSLSSFLGALVCAFFFAAFTAQMCYDGSLRNIAFWGFSRCIRMPGMIFKLSADGIIFMLLYKLIAPIIGVLLGILIGIVATIAAFVIAPFSVVFSMIMLWHKGTIALKEEREANTATEQ